MPECRKCHEKFPRWIKIDNRARNLSSRKFCLTCSPFNLHNTVDLTKGPRVFLDRIDLSTDKSVKLCPRCQEYAPIAQFYISRAPNKSPRLRAYCKPCASQKTVETQRRNKTQAVQYKGGKCQDCGLIENACVYDFHHLDPDKKEFSIASYKSRNLSSVMKAELDKCALLCSNCHRLRHFTETISRAKENQTKI